jgi:hypothetical protein
MNPNWEDNRIRDLFVELRSHDEAQAPGFDGVWGAAVARAKSARRRRYFVRVALIAAAVVVSSLIVGRAFFRDRRPQTVHVPSAPFIQAADLPWQTAVLICEWRSPTDFLLRSPGEHPFEPLLNNFPAGPPKQKQ